MAYAETESSGTKQQDEAELAVRQAVGASSAMLQPAGVPSGHLLSQGLAVTASVIVGLVLLAGATVYFFAVASFALRRAVG